ncbi:Plant organelle RNA recognition domain [Dillenia turbinata]|uniref:Plant organelle RNA recognition domain n=1 Tax=Dillenia turbinata TaxID=194707 RepID=A0AAN8ZL69_9MAGN
MALISWKSEWAVPAIEEQGRERGCEPRREFGLPEILNVLLLKYFGIFYVSNKYQIYTVLLREGYNGLELVNKDPFVAVKEKFGELMREGLHEEEEEEERVALVRSWEGKDDGNETLEQVKDHGKDFPYRKLKRQTIEKKGNNCRSKRGDLEAAADAMARPQMQTLGAAEDATGILVANTKLADIFIHYGGIWKHEANTSFKLENKAVGYPLKL